MTGTCCSGLFQSCERIAFRDRHKGGIAAGMMRLSGWKERFVQRPHHAQDATSAHLDRDEPVPAFGRTERRAPQLMADEPELASAVSTLVHGTLLGSPSAE